MYSLMLTVVSVNEGVGIFGSGSAQVSSCCSRSEMWRVRNNQYIRYCHTPITHFC